MLLQQFGGKITPSDLQRYEASPNWKDGSFQNMQPTALDMPLRKLPEVMYKQFFATKKNIPKQNLSILPFDLSAFLAPSPMTKIIWYGHSVILMRMQDKTILIDPMLGPDTTPIAPTSSLRYSKDTLALIDDFPPIDLVLITHDHYDHLDYASIQKLKPKVKQFFVALGVKRHLTKWGVNTSIIQEFDWWDTQHFHTVDITFTPTQHFSGRGLTDRQKSLWGGWAFRTPTEKIWFSGDGGYNTHFQEIGRQLGPFDFAMMECGQYNDNWRPVHLFPNESVQAALEAGVRKAMPVHWAGFYLSFQHTWSEPAQAFVQAAQEQQLDYLLPRLGQLFTIQDTNQVCWWETIE